jgi:DHA3 family tetracycline resistance protein-like MFS transporter
VRRSALLAGLVAGTVFAGMSSEGFDRLSQPHFLKDLTFPGTAAAESWFGAFAVVAALGSIIATGLIGRRLDTLHPRRVGRLLAVIQALTAAGVICFGLTGSFWTAVTVYLVVVLLRDTTTPILTVWLVSATTSASRATVFSIQAQADALGQIAGGPPVGVIGQRRTIGAGIATSGFFLVPAVALFALAARRSPAGSSSRSAIPSPWTPPPCFPPVRLAAAGLSVSPATSLDLAAMSPSSRRPGLSPSIGPHSEWNSTAASGAFRPPSSSIDHHRPAP